MKGIKHYSFWLSCIGIIALLVSLGITSSGSVVGNAKFSVSVAKAMASVTDYGAVGDGSTNDSKAFSDAFSDMSAKVNGGSLQIPAGTYYLASSITVPQNVELVFHPNACLSVASGVTLTYNGSIVAGDQTIFSGAGTVTGVPTNPVGNPMWFGAVADGVTDNSSAFQNALAVFNELEVPCTSAGFAIKSVHISKEKTYIHGRNNQKAKIVGLSGASGIFLITQHNTSVTHLNFEMANAGTAACFYFDDTHSSVVGGISQVYINNVDANAAYCFARDALTQTFKIHNVYFEDLNLTAFRNTAFRTKAMYGFIFLTNINMDYSSSSVNMTFPAVSVEENEGMILNGLTIKGQGANSGDAHGIYIKRSVAVWLLNCNISNMGGNGIYTYTTSSDYGGHNRYLYIHKNNITACANGIEVTYGTEVQLQENTVTNVRNSGLIITGKLIQASKNVCNNNNNGIESSAQNSVFYGNTTLKNAKYGIYSTGKYCSVANHASADNGSSDRVSGSGSGSVQITPSFSDTNNGSIGSSTPNVQEDRFNITYQTEVAKDGNTALSAYGNGFRLTATTASNIVVPISDPSIFTSRPYLVFDLGESSTATMTLKVAWNNATWFEGGAVFEGASVSTYKGTTVVDFTSFINEHSNDTMWIYIYITPNAQGSNIDFNEFYFSNVNPLS